MYFKQSLKISKCVPSLYFVIFSCCLVVLKFLGCFGCSCRLACRIFLSGVLLSQLLSRTVRQLCCRCFGSKGEGGKLLPFLIFCELRLLFHRERTLRCFHLFWLAQLKVAFNRLYSWLHFEHYFYEWFELFH